MPPIHMRGVPMARKRSGRTAQDVINDNRKAITERFASMISDPTLDWVRQWSGSSVASPCNPCSGTRYNGGNRLALTFAAETFRDNRFCTYRQAQRRGWQVNRGAEGFLVEKWGTVRVYERDDDGNVVTDEDGHRVVAFRYFRPLAYYTVFNFAEIEGAPEYVAPKPPTPDANTRLMDGLMFTSACPVFEGVGDRACYRPIQDRIDIPSREVFDDTTAALHTLLHEMGHSTGHGSRLARPGIVDFDGFGSERYAFEELVAELCSVFTASYLGAGAMQDEGHRRNHAAYLQGWLSKLGSDPDYLFKAAAQAERASDLIVELLVAACPDLRREVEAIPELEADAD